MDADLEDCERRVRAWERKMNYYRERTARLEEALKDVMAGYSPVDEEVIVQHKPTIEKAFAALESESRV